MFTCINICFCAFLRRRSHPLDRDKGVASALWLRVRLTRRAAWVELVRLDHVTFSWCSLVHSLSTVYTKEIITTSAGRFPPLHTALASATVIGTRSPAQIPPPTPPRLSITLLCTLTVKHARHFNSFTPCHPSAYLPSHICHRTSAVNVSRLTLRFSLLTHLKRLDTVCTKKTLTGNCLPHMGH